MKHVDKMVLGAAVLLAGVACSKDKSEAKSPDEQMTPASEYAPNPPREYTPPAAAQPETQPETEAEMFREGVDESAYEEEEGTAFGEAPGDLEAEEMADTRRATATFSAVEGLELEGEAKFEEVANGVKVTVAVDDAPTGMKGIHVHEKGDCSDIAGKSMGEHFAPGRERHGMPTGAQRHLGDLGNITIDDDGEGKLEIVVSGANLKPNDRMSFLGKAIVIHESKDVGASAQPAGGSGKPIACAVIR